MDPGAAQVVTKRFWGFKTGGWNEKVECRGRAGEAAGGDGLRSSGGGSGTEGSGGRVVVWHGPKVGAADCGASAGVWQLSVAVRGSAERSWRLRSNFFAASESRSKLMPWNSSILLNITRAADLRRRWFVSWTRLNQGFLGILRSGRRPFAVGLPQARGSVVLRRLEQREETSLDRTPRHVLYMRRFVYGFSLIRSWPLMLSVLPSEIFRTPVCSSMSLSLFRNSRSE